MTTLTGVVSYPISAYQNPPIEPQFYQPSRFVISAISLGTTTIVTTSVAHNYVIGQEVRLLIPANCGSFQLNNLSGFVLSIPSTTQVEVNINSSMNVNSFVVGTGICSPQIIAIGDVNAGQINSNGLSSTLSYIPGSFLNISP